MKKEDIFRIVEEEDVEFIRLQFTDMFGSLKNIAITVSQLEKALSNKFIFDGSSIDGFVKVEESDMYLHPDMDTFQIFPWRPQQGKVARFICDVHKPDGNPFDADSRSILKKVIHRASEKGLTFFVAPECEFFLFSIDENGNPTFTSNDKASYFDVGPLDNAENVRRDIVLNMEEMGYEIASSHHEMAPSQHEIDFVYTNALFAADEIMTFKMAVKTLAKRHGFYATFMPKPKEDINGSGLHLNMSLYDEKGENLFVDHTDENGLSKTAYHFMAGIMKYAREMSLITNPTVNSYKRLVPGFDAPTHISWSASANRSTLIRVPSNRENDIRIELRSPDATSNPYLMLATVLAAGLEGMERGLLPGESISENIFEWSAEETKKRNLLAMPTHMGEAIEEFEKSSFLREVLGDITFDKYLHAKKKEWKNFLSSVTDWENQEYLYKY